MQDRAVYCKDKDNCVCLWCPVHQGIFCIDKEELVKPEIKCPVCGAVLVLMPKDPNILWQSLLYKEMQLILRKIEKEYLGGRW
ncbi:MAG: hypothetical protein ACXQTI_08540 [Candidatus Nezhaarchaeales archaeon]